VTKTYAVSQPDSLEFNAEITHVSDSGEMDGSITVQVSGGISPYTYQWESQAGGDTLTDLTPGVYNLTVIDENGCMKNKSFEVSYQSNSTDINESGKPDQGTEIKLYPNPAQSAIQVVCKDKSGGSFFLILLTINGKKLLTQPIVDERTEVSLNKFPSGVYLVKIFNSQRQTVEAAKIFIK
jgi:hypothetical protein